MRPPRLWQLLLVTTMLLTGSLAAQEEEEEPVRIREKPDGMAMTTSLPGTGFGLDERGRLDPGGVQQLNIPVGYTLSGGDWLATGWAGRAGGGGENGQASLSLGLGAAGQGLSLTAVGTTDIRHRLTGHVQKQLWTETRLMPAVSAGVLDVSGNIDRSFYIAATKRLNGRGHPKKPVLSASVPAWPPGDRAPNVRDPATWGRLTISPLPLRELTEPTLPTQIVAPHSDFPSPLDGMLTSDWQDASQVKVALPGSELLLLGAKHTGAVLYVVVAVPSDRELVPGSRAELCFGPPGSAQGPLCSVHRRYALQWGRDKDQVELFQAHGADGEWVETRVGADSRRPPQRFTGAILDAGDGGWRFPVFEFAIPLTELLPSGMEAEVAFAAFAHLPGGQRGLSTGEKWGTDTIRWPGSDKSTFEQTSKLLGKRPDLWGAVVLGARPRGSQRLGAPMVTRAPTVDGQMAAGEWEGADSRVLALMSGVEQTLYALRTDEALYMAVTAAAAVGARQRQVTSLYLDPEGDGGLTPRPDDRCIRVTHEATATRVEVLSWDQKREQWSLTHELPVDAVTAPEAAPAGTRTVTEVRIPLGCLGPLPKGGRTKAVGLAVETSITTSPTRLARQGMALERGSGKSTYATVAWGSGIYDREVVWGISHPIGAYRGIAEWDGDQFNVGLSGSPPGTDRLRLTVGYNGVSRGLRGKHDTGPLFGAAFTASF